MAFVEYDRELDYRYDALLGGRYPMLQFHVARYPDFAGSVDVDAHLDSGAELSLFDGALIGRTLGVDLFDGRPINYQSASGWSLEARLHQLHFEHDALGKFELRVGLSTVPIQRNLLGRDFFDLFQIGFREHHQTVLLKASP